MNSFVKAKSASFFVEPNVNTYIVTTGGSAIVATLPDARAPRRSRFIVVKKADSGGGTVVLTPVNSQTIDGSSTKTITAQWQSITLSNDGSNWDIVASFPAASVTAPLSLSDTETSSTPGTVRTIIGDMVVTPAASAAGSGSLVGVRGTVTLTTGKAITAGFLYGTQGKGIFNGTLNNGSGFNCGIFAQLDVSSASFAHTSGYMAPIIADFSTAAHLATDALADMIVLLNTSTCAINSIIHTEAKASYLFDLNDLGQGAYIVATAKGSGWDKSLKIKVNGTDYYIPINSAAS